VAQWKLRRQELAQRFMPLLFLIDHIIGRRVDEGRYVGRSGLPLRRVRPVLFGNRGECVPKSRGILVLFLLRQEQLAEVELAACGDNGMFDSGAYDPVPDLESGLGWCSISWL